jgi:hypothetical protein
MKTFEIRASLDMQFGHGVVKAGTLIGTLIMHEPVEPTSLLSMTQFHQATISEVESLEIKSVESIEIEQPNDTTLAGPDSDENDDDLTDVFVDTVESNEVSDLAEFFDESIIESLVANEIKTKEQLLAYVDSGANLVDLDKIGATRAKRIMAAVALMRPAQQ